MVRLLSVLLLAGSAMIAFGGDDGPSDDELKKKPITTDTGEIGKLLTKWYKEGTAAGNVGDWYDNRDGEHSPLDLTPYPQLRKVAYSAADVKAHRHWALQPRVLPHVVFGNSSTSAPPQYSGSNPRSYYCSPAGLNLLQAHYAKNNLYIYPEHRDHDPGHNGVGDGYGDLYPTNTPFLLISQGSSGSDQPFMHAIPFTLAAFRPDVKKKLVETGLLMPTVQMILRSTNRQVKKPDDYLTGKVHPTVFEGSDVDALAMVKKAHIITIDDIPPLVKLAVSEEDRPVNGMDYFEPIGLTEKLTETTAVIARIWRGASGQRRMVVTAGESIDVNKKPLTFRWVVLRGDEKRIRIKPLDKAGTEAEIIVDYHKRRPIAPGSAMESNRVDIGVFAFNGVFWSAPAFITFFSLDSEARSYDAKGRVREVGYGASSIELKIVDIAKVLSALSKPPLASGPLGLSHSQRKELAKASVMVEKLEKGLAERRRQLQEARQARDKAVASKREAKKKLAAIVKAKNTDSDSKELARGVEVAEAEEKARQAKWAATNKAVGKAESALNKVLDTELGGLEASPRAFTAKALKASLEWLMDDGPQRSNVQRLAEKAGDGPGGRVRAAETAFSRIRLTPKADELTSLERSALERFAAVVLTEGLMLGAIQPVFHVNFVDARLTAPKRWRDVYHYEGDTLTGWTRFVDGKPGKADYTTEGWRVVKRDDKGRPIEACTVEYRQARAPAGTMWANPHPLEPHDGTERITFTYEDGKRKVKSREKVAPEDPAKK